MKNLTTIVSLLALLSIPTSARAQNREHQQMAAEMRMLQESAQLLSQALTQTLNRLNELGESVKGLNESLKKVEGRLDAAEATSRTAAANQKLALDSMSADLRIIREGTQIVNTRIGVLTGEVEALRTAMPPAGAATAPVTTGPDGQLIEGAAPTAAASVPRSGLPAHRLFQEAFADYASGKYSLAIKGFQKLLAEWPKSDQADDAQYYIGFSYSADKKYPEAVKAFSDVVANYPTGDKVPDAYLELGQSYRALAQNDSARDAWQTLIARYPTSNPAILARQKLEGLGPAPAPSKP
jgi:tol-pal system protein YbgF